MAPNIANFPPTPAELADYHDYTLDDFHDWWIEYHDSLLIQRPDHEIKTIPAGPKLAELMLEFRILLRNKSYFKRSLRINYRLGFYFRQFIERVVLKSQTDYARGVTFH